MWTSFTCTISFSSFVVFCSGISVEFGVSSAALKKASSAPPVNWLLSIILQIFILIAVWFGGSPKRLKKVNANEKGISTGGADDGFFKAADETPNSTEIPEQNTTNDENDISTSRRLMQLQLTFDLKKPLIQRQHKPNWLLDSICKIVDHREQIRIVNMSWHFFDIHIMSCMRRR